MNKLNEIKDLDGYVVGHYTEVEGVVNIIKLKNIKGNILYCCDVSKESKLNQCIKFVVEKAVSEGVSLSKVNLPFSDLSCADLTNADLSGADLEGANLTNSNLTNVDFTLVDLDSVKMSLDDLDKVKKKLTKEQIKSIIINN